jgi:hypothetical protein
MKKYEIVLQNKKAKIYSTISWLIIALNLLAFLYFGIAKLADQFIYPLLGASCLALIFIFYFIVRRKKDRENRPFIISFIIIVLTWITMGFYFPAAINLLLFFFQDITRRKLEIVVAVEKIGYPSFPKRTILWNELSNLILKDGLLTIDFKNNKIIQQLIEKTEHPVNEKEFNDFCNKQLQSAAQII